MKNFEIDDGALFCKNEGNGCHSTRLVLRGNMEVKFDYEYGLRKEELQKINEVKVFAVCEECGTEEDISDKYGVVWEADCYFPQLIELHGSKI